MNYTQHIWQIIRKWVKTQPLRFLSKESMGTLPSTQNTFSMLLDWICHGTVLVTNCDKSQIATVEIPELSQFVTVAICDGSKHNFSDRFHGNRGYTPKYRKHVHIDIRSFQEGLLGTSIRGIIIDIHTNIYTLLYAHFTPTRMTFIIKITTWIDRSCRLLFKKSSIAPSFVTSFMDDFVNVTELGTWR